MATIALTRPVAPHRASSGMASLGSAISLDIDMDMDPMADQPAQADASAAPSTAPSPQPQAAAHLPPPPPPVPNKHIPVCPPGPPLPPTTPSPSPPPGEADRRQLSLLYPPPDHYPRADRGDLVLYRIEPADVAAALDFAARQPLPDPSLVFPWLHGLHPSNAMQQSFFSQRRRLLRATPCCLRGVTVVKTDGQLHKARLKGAIAPDEFLQLDTACPAFLDPDPREGFSVRNFQIQAAKTAMTSDIVVYGDDDADPDAVESLAWDVAAAQHRWRRQHALDGQPLPAYNTFVCTASFAVFEEAFPTIVAVAADGALTGHVLDFFHQERQEMYAMTAASEIAHNVWLGPTPEPDSPDEDPYDVLIECSDLGRLNPNALRALLVDQAADDLAADPAADPPPRRRKVYLDFPSSGTILPPTWSHAEADAILACCRWIHRLAHGLPSTSGEGDDDDQPQPEEPGARRPPPRPRKVLIHCADGYTESTLLGLAYFSYSTGRPIPDAWLALHTAKQRNFFAYPTDVALLTALAPRLLCASPACADKSLGTVTALVRNPPKWFAAMDGSFPSRILPYMYLGNLNHANNPELLRALGITQILSVGEMAAWRDGELDTWGEDNVCIVQGVQDNGIDPLTDEFERCLDFLERGRKKGTATLVHCRVGVSRSATICIAEVMRSLKLSLPRAYCFVRARRLNVIIQPHLRFAYELLKWEELLRQDQGQDQAGAASPLGGPPGIKRELEWGEIAREVALMNQPYVR